MPNSVFGNGSETNCDRTANTTESLSLSLSLRLYSEFHFERTLAEMTFPRALRENNARAPVALRPRHFPKFPRWGSVFQNASRSRCTAHMPCAAISDSAIPERDSARPFALLDSLQAL